MLTDAQMQQAINNLNILIAHHNSPISSFFLTMSELQGTGFSNLNQYMLLP